MSDYCDDVNNKQDVVIFSGQNSIMYNKSIINIATSEDYKHGDNLLLIESDLIRHKKKLLIIG